MANLQNVYIASCQTYWPKKFLVNTGNKKRKEFTRNIKYTFLN